MRQRVHIAVLCSAILCSCSTRRTPQPTSVPSRSVTADSTGQYVAVTSEPVASSKVAPGELAGMVVDAATGKPLAGSPVSIAASARGTLTDSIGRFRIALPRGPVKLLVRRIGYQSVQLDVPERPDSGLVAVVALRSSPVRLCYVSVGAPHPGPAGVSVVVRDAITAGPPSSAVRLLVRDGSFSDSTTARVTADGRVVAAAAMGRAGNYEVILHADGYKEWTGRGSTQPDPDCSSFKPVVVDAWLVPA